MAGATVAYACIASRQLDAIKRQADIAERHITQLERPRIIVELHGPGRVVWDENPIREFLLVNGGRSPARIIFERIILDEIRGAFPEDPPLGEPEPRVETIMRANGERGSFRQVIMASLRWERLCKGESTLVFFGCVKYRDTFSKPTAEPYEHRFCYLFEPQWPWDGIGEIPEELIGRWRAGGPPNWTKNT